MNRNEKELQEILDDMLPSNPFREYGQSLCDHKYDVNTEPGYVGIYCIKCGKNASWCCEASITESGHCSECGENQ